MILQLEIGGEVLGIKAKPITDKLLSIGERIDLIPDTEVSKSVLSLRFAEARLHEPRVDILWSQRLKAIQSQTISGIIGVDENELLHLPVVGIEIEATDPTTKTLETDIANLASLGPPLGLVVIDTKEAPDMYLRASRIIRSMRYMYGNLVVLPVDNQWLPQIEKALARRSPAIVIPREEARKGTGKESAWTKRQKKVLRRLGEDAGFAVRVEWTPPSVQRAFEIFNAYSTPEGKLYTSTRKGSSERKSINKAGDYFTSSRLDVVWLLKLPNKLRLFLECLCERDPDLIRFLHLFPDDWGYIPLVGFELESSGGKHAGGALLNLAAHTIIGVCVVPDETIESLMQNKLNTYRPTLGLRNVYVRCRP